MSFGNELKDFVSAFNGTSQGMYNIARTKKLMAPKEDPVADAFKEGYNAPSERGPNPPKAPPSPAQAAVPAETKVASADPTSAIPVEVPPGAAGGDNLDPTEHMAYLVGKLGLDPKIAAAMLGNAWHESGDLNPTVVGDNGGSFGLYQFNVNGRQPEFRKWAESNKRDPNTYDAQHEFALYDLQTNFPKTFKSMQEAPDVDTATDVFMREYERPKAETAHGDRRRKRALEAFDLYNNFKPAAQSTGQAGALDLR